MNERIDKLEQRIDMMQLKYIQLLHTKKFRFKGGNWDEILEQVKKKLEKYEPGNVIEVCIKHDHIIIKSIEVE